MADLQAQQEREFQEQQRAQQAREREAQEALANQQQQMQYGMNAGRIAELEREILGMRGQWERDQMMLERYDHVRRLGSGETVREDSELTLARPLHSE